MTPPVKPGHLALYGGAFRHDVARPGKCRMCQADIVGPPNKKYCDACRKGARNGKEYRRLGREAA